MLKYSIVTMAVTLFGSMIWALVVPPENSAMMLIRSGVMAIIVIGLTEVVYPMPGTKRWAKKRVKLYLRSKRLSQDVRIAKKVGDLWMVAAFYGKPPDRKRANYVVYRDGEVS